MKKFIITLLSLLFFCVPAMAEYKPIPENLSKQYKTEMEQIIDEKYPIVIKKIDNEVKDAKRIRDKILEIGFNIEDYITLSLIPETCIPSSDLDLYGKMLKVTKEKYLNETYTPIGTDSVNPIDDILSPYFIDNKVNRSKLTKILLYENKQIKVVEEYIKQVEKLRPTSNQNIY
ncbi:TPA: hypothetical protein IAC10_13765 [Candidatus Scatousia excrementigallinarum]|uniref:Uncharacterized protein n=1 Tax=Candidatus Scatousia excrementigallinarum TaxID=2840935 RepID=A0A9D1JP39_9BACT|nr:hypothetical protein [Candidatus Scatousia excrementigallinarum]